MIWNRRYEMYRIWLCHFNESDIPPKEESSEPEDLTSRNINSSIYAPQQPQIVKFLAGGALPSREPRQISPLRAHQHDKKHAASC